MDWHFVVGVAVGLLIALVLAVVYTMGKDASARDARRGSGK